MAVTVVDRPVGYKISNTQKSGQALSTDIGELYILGAHDLVDGDYVYIESNIESYNGFWYILVDATFPNNIFYIYDREGGDQQTFIQESDIVFYKVIITHGWQCVHLPIVYKLHSDLIPNTVDTVSLLGAEYESSPYMNFALPDSLGFQALDYGLFKSDTDDPGTPYQILSVVSIGGGNSVVTINKAQGSSGLYSFQKYYNNYYVLVNVYAGLPSGHHWESEKPYELAGTLKFIPDSNGDVMFSVSELLKGYITTRNNLQLDTLPNNIDFWTSFYIEYTEGYDTSNGTVVTSFVDELTSDQEEFEGQAVNAMLPFKNIYSGWMSEYVGSEESPGRWLTTEDVPLIVDGYYFDLSFIRPVELIGLLTLSKSFYKNGLLLDTTLEGIQDYGEGIYRIEIQNNCQEFPIYSGLTSIISNSQFSLSIDGWTTLLSPSDVWGWNNSPAYFNPGNGYAIRNQESDSSIARFYTPFTNNLFAGDAIILRTRFSGLQEFNEYTMKVYIDQPDPLAFFQLIGTYSFTLDEVTYERTVDEQIIVPEIVPGYPITGVFFTIEGGENTGNKVFVDYFDILIGDETVTYVSADTVKVSVLNLIEPITINLVCDCNNTFLNDDLRLLETGGVRELE